MAKSYGPQVAQVNEESPSESFLDLTLTQHSYNEDPEPWKVHARLEVEPLWTWYYRIFLNSCTLVVLLQVDPAFGDEFETTCESCYKTENISIFAWSSILSVGHYHWLHDLIRRLPPNSKGDYLVRTIWHILDFLQLWVIMWHSPRFNMLLLFFVELIHNMNKCYIHYETLFVIATLSHYLFNRYIISNKSYVYKARRLLYLYGTFHWHPSMASWISNILAIH